MFAHLPRPTRNFHQIQEYWRERALNCFWAKQEQERKHLEKENNSHILAMCIYNYGARESNGKYGISCGKTCWRFDFAKWENIFNEKEMGTKATKIVKLKTKRTKERKSEMRWDATTLHFGVRILQRFFKLDKSDMPYSRVTQRGWKVIIWMLRMDGRWIAMEMWEREREGHAERESKRTNWKEFNNKIGLFILFLLRAIYVCECVWMSVSIYFCNHDKCRLRQSLFFN